MKINCDVGEGLDEVDQQLMPLIDMASIACGGHAGDAASMSRTIDCAIANNTEIGAHPSYPDRENFGRRTLNIDARALHDSICRQVESLRHCAQQLGTEITYIKPHGALYNDAFRASELQKTLLAIARNMALKLVVQAHPQQTQNSTYIFEAFVDRAYNDDGALLDRTCDNAVYENVNDAVNQARDLHTKQGVFTASGRWLTMNADTVCIHSDTPNSIAIVRAVREAIS